VDEDRADAGEDSDLSLEDVEELAIFGLVGQVMYFAQAIEFALALMIVVHDHLERRFTTVSDFDGAMRDWLQQPMGEKVRGLYERKPIPPAGRRKLDEATKDRNRIAHWFLMEWGFAGTAQARRAAIDELETMSDRLEKLANGLIAANLAGMEAFMSTGTASELQAVSDAEASAYLTQLIGKAKKRRKIPRRGRERGRRSR
jgi:hypothetical protein